VINYATELAMICVMPLNNFYAKTSFTPRLSLRIFT